jgi:hypothetical protein
MLRQVGCFRDDLFELVRSSRSWATTISIDNALGEVKTLRCLASCPEKALLVRTLWLNYWVEMPGILVVRALGGAVAGMMALQRLYIFTTDDEALAAGAPFFNALSYVIFPFGCVFGLNF